MKKLLLLFTLAFFFFIPLLAQNQNAQNKFRLAQSFEQAGEYDRAVRLYEDLANADSLNYTYFDGLRRCYEQLKNYHAAIAIILRRLKYQPNDINLMASLGGIYYKAGSEQEADSAWNATLAFLPTNFASYIVVATVQSENRLFDKAIATYLQGRKKIGDPSLFVGELAALQSLMMNYSEATREYITMLSLNEHQLDFIESRLSTYTSKEEGLVAATKVAEEAVAHQRNTIVLQRLLLWLYMEGKQFDKAFDVAKDLDEAITSNGAEMVAFGDRAFKEKAYDAAARAYRFAIEKYPNMPQIPVAKFGYARSVEELSAPADTVSVSRLMSDLLPSETHPNYRGAEGLFLSLSTEYPFSEISLQSLYRVGLIRYKRFFDLNGSMRVLDSALELSRNRRMEPTVLETMGEIEVAQGKLDEASRRYAAMFSSPFAAPEEKTQAQFHLAEIQYFENNFDSASSMLQKISQTLSADETNDALLLLHFIKENQAGFTDALKEYVRAELLEREAKFSESIPILASIVQTYPDAPLADDALIKKAELSTAINLPGDALISYKKLLSDFPKSIFRDKAQFRIGELYQFSLKDKEKAIQAYEELLSSYPNSLFGEETRKRIRLLRGDSI